MAAEAKAEYVKLLCAQCKLATDLDYRIERVAQLVSVEPDGAKAVSAMVCAHTLAAAIAAVRLDGVTIGNVLGGLLPARAAEQSELQFEVAPALGGLITVRFSASEMELLRGYVRRTGGKLTDLLRSAALAEAERA